MITNADGSTPVQMLGQLGITEQRLTADTTRIQKADGSAITGHATLVQGRVTKTLANVAPGTAQQTFDTFLCGTSP
jgi:hypothetical protein